MTLIKILLALASIIMGIVTMVTVWMKFHFFVPKRNSWTKSPLDQLGLKFGNSVTWGIGSGLLFYLMSDHYLTNHFPDYAKSKTKSELSKPALEANSPKDPDPREKPPHEQKTNPDLSAIPSTGQSSNEPGNTATLNQNEALASSGTLSDLRNEQVHEKITQPAVALQSADNQLRSLALPPNNKQKEAEPIIYKDFPERKRETINIQNASPAEAVDEENQKPNREQDPRAQVAMIGERYPETRLQKIDENFTKSLGDAQLRYAINEMYARHGAVFPQQEINRVFDPMTWYCPDTHLSFDQIEALFTDLEKMNLKVLGQVRNERKGKTPRSSQENPGNTSSEQDRVRFIDGDGQLRSGPGTNFPIIRTPSKGERAVIERRSGLWIMLRFDSGETGWAHEKNLERWKPGQ